MAELSVAGLSSARGAGTTSPEARVVTLRLPRRTRRPQGEEHDMHGAAW